MIPISDDNPTLRTPVMNYVIIAVIAGVWIFIQGAGFDQQALASSVCNLGMVPGELTKLATLGESVPIGPGLVCSVDQEPINLWTPLTSMFLHGGWMHILGNLLFLWVFGNNIEDSMGRFRFLVFYLLCGLIAAGAHVLVDSASPVPTVGASGAISGVMGGYLVLYPRVRVRMLFVLIVFIQIISVPAWVALGWWIGWQVVSGLPQLTQAGDPTGGVAFWAHIGGFAAGAVLVKLFENRNTVAERTRLRHRLHPDHP